ncbi:MAG: hypothetical protein WBV69_15230, partial [Candidatus Sulfotelmatobacter sp.]
MRIARQRERQNRLHLNTLTGGIKFQAFCCLLLRFHRITERSFALSGNFLPYSPSFLGGTVVFGFYVIGSGWEIYYQTWGDIEYKRPKTAVHAKRTMGPEHRAQDYK